MARGRTAAGWTAIGAAVVYVALHADWVSGVTDLGDVAQELTGGLTGGVHEVWLRLQDAVIVVQVLCAAIGLLLLLVKRAGRGSSRSARSAGGR